MYVATKYYTFYQSLNRGMYTNLFCRINDCHPSNIIQWALNIIDRFKLIKLNVIGYNLDFFSHCHWIGKKDSPIITTDQLPPEARVEISFHVW